MIPIKIQCACGQRYAFEIEPVDGRVPAPVTCPACGADGTAAANAAIAEAVAAQPATASTARAPLRVELSAAPARTAPRSTTTVLPGQIDSTQAQFEARAKILWGDPPHEVTRYLMIHGFNPEEASNLVEELCRERAAAIRARGIGKALIGALMVSVPIIAFFTFMALGYFLLKTFIATVFLGFWGLWLVIKGATMILSPQSEPGDVTEK